MEDNEWSFCSLWTAKRKAGCAKALVNERLAGDYFFNRASVEGCPAGEEKKIGRVFWEKGMDCYLYFRVAPQSLRVVDTMHVLQSAGAGKGGNVVQVERSGIQTWVDIFCESFGVPDWKAEVKRIVTRHFAKLTLLTGYVDDMPAGCAALYKENGLTGLYCLGTLPRFRGKGVAKNILLHAQHMAKADSAPLFLQTLESYGLLDYYKKMGFKIAYQKTICQLSSEKMD